MIAEFFEENMKESIDDEAKTLMEFSADGSWVEILGHRIDSYGSFEEFTEQIKKWNEMENENKILKENWVKLRKFVTLYTYDSYKILRKMDEMEREIGYVR